PRHATGVGRVAGRLTRPTSSPQAPRARTLAGRPLTYFTHQLSVLRVATDGGCGGWAGALNVVE
ncbi:hypothetical protein AAHZ94_02435, partial [Streptomyces sp. HSW2009]|uniref:hypothetical protein n=1 Tax=Streptomyces sp. HSW2009 TaxID=3142890 RepID=UPI0032EB7AFB